MLEIGTKQYRNRRATAPPLTSEVKALLAAGVSPMTVNDQGHDAVEIMLAANAKDNQNTRTSAAALVAVRYFIDAGYPILDRGTLGLAHGDLFKDLLRDLAERTRKGNVVLDAHGGNSCHWLAQHDPLRLSECLLQDRMVASRSSWCIDQKSASHHRESDGATPLHLLWRSSFCSEKPEVGLFTSWFITESLVERLGVLLAAPDHQGRQVLREMQDAGAFEPTASSLQDTMSDFRAKAATQLMEVLTPSSIRAGRAGPRL